MAKFKHNPITNELDLIGKGSQILEAVLDTVSGSLVFNKGNSSTIDFQAKSLNSDTIFFIDSSADRVGIGLSGLLPTDGLLHIQSGTAGTVTASANADELVIEGIGITGLSILTPVAGTASITFGRPGSSAAGAIQYSQTSQIMTFNSEGDEFIRLQTATTIINAPNLGAVDFRVAGTSNSNLFFCDVSANRIGITSAAIAPTDGLLHIQSGTAGTVTASTGGNELVLEGSGNVGLSILAGSTSNSTMYFGSSIANVSGLIRYQHALDTFQFFTQSSKLILSMSDTEMLINDGGLGTVDFSMEGAANTKLIFADSSANRIGFSNASLAPTDGLVHIQSGSAGSITASTSADELVIEGSGITGISIFGGSTSALNIFFGHSTNNNIGRIVYNAATNGFSFITNDSTGLTIDSNQNVSIGSVSAAASAVKNLHIPIGVSPTASIIGGIVIGTKDASVGTTDATLELWFETSPIVIATFTASHKFPIWINGTEYHIQLDAV